MKAFLVVAVGVLVALVSPVVGQAPGSLYTQPTPVLTDTQKLQLTLALTRADLAHLKRQQAEQELEKALTDVQALLTSLHRQGFDLDTTALVYRPVAKAAKEGER